MNRKKFIESFGATCKNWTWSWSFVNHDEKFVIFGAWDNPTEKDRALILGEDWSHRASDGVKNKGFPQSREHIRLIESGSYRLFTFPIYVSDELRDAEGNGPSKIDHFDPLLTQKTLRKEVGGWYAYEYVPDFQSPEELQDPQKYIEGACKSVTVNAYERNRDARAVCIKAHGTACAVCGFDFAAKYGPEFLGFIHVHHLVPVSARQGQYELDPVKDLRPVCPNCHAVIHYGNGLLSINEVKERLRRATGA
jgi:5-methylcytosine-specific restriction enzyme A